MGGTIKSARDLGQIGSSILFWFPSTHGQAFCNSLVLCQQVTYGPCSGWFEVKNQSPDAERCKVPNSNPFHSSFPYISVLKESLNLCRRGTGATQAGPCLGGCHLCNRNAEGRAAGSPSDCLEQNYFCVFQYVGILSLRLYKY